MRLSKAAMILPSAVAIIAVQSCSVSAWVGKKLLPVVAVVGTSESDTGRRRPEGRGAAAAEVAAAAAAALRKPSTTTVNVCTYCKFLKP